jgi:hypothetical protein
MVAGTNRHTAGQEDGPKPALVYDALLGGTTNFAADRRAARLLKNAKPDLVPNILASRRFLVRGVDYLTRDEGVRQFLDIGTGIPASDPTHEVAQRVNPAARVLYADNDPVVLVHAKALLDSTPEGACTFINADLRDPAGILEQARPTLDLDEPVAVMLLGILYYLTDAEDPYAIVRQLMAATVPGSYLMISHPASDLHAGAAAKAAGRYGELTGIPQTNRSHREVTGFFEGLELLEPGVVEANRWRPGPDDDPRPQLSNWVGTARKP